MKWMSKSFGQWIAVEISRNRNYFINGTSMVHTQHLGECLTTRKAGREDLPHAFRQLGYSVEENMNG
jgi:hypothetical protein